VERRASSRLYRTVKHHRTIVLCCSMLATLLAWSPDAQAMCGLLVLDDEPQRVVFGEYALWGPCTPEVCGDHPLGYAGACVIEQDGTRTFHAFVGCDDETIAADQIFVYTRGGDDRVGVLLDEHGELLDCDVGAIYPWSDDFAFGIAAWMGEGSDTFVGSPGADWAVSSEFSGQVPVADGSFDLICGGDGNDSLNGDRDDDWTTGREEILDGGAGNDYCDGDPNSTFNGGNVSDVVVRCDNAGDKDATTWAGADGLCAAQSNPLEWF
jgi:hypothetical protein